MAAIDLNLVRVFDALMVHRSVSAAAAALNLTQPAVSNALRRLRALTDDDLFVRTRRGMEPTAFALAAGGALSEGLRLIRQGLERAAPFEPATTRRQFRILMTDAGEMVFLPRLMPQLRAKAPMLDIRVLQLPIARYLEALETDQADLAVGNLRPKAGTFVLRRLFEEHHVIVCRRGHPLELSAGQDGVARLDQILESHHVIVRPPNSVDVPLDNLIQAHRWRIRVALEVPHFLVLAGILNQTDMVAVVPSLVAAELVRRSDLVILQVPFICPGISIRLGWHIRQQKDAGNRWLRQQIIELMSARTRAGEASRMPQA
ncbi:LysR family transcriptional regulator [Xanthobacter dioxanivorans]|uniref:LysR family transcriptional regulator n=1 Tax=Xanthobacter dioxanivorans TaxID=2528964 RepID=A0A974PMV3_9HYPH|nr:LysR family transcriptional regulator [Xanthobacter dioxanivorans]QRG06231.1 LysR family transcriptional regulator [Xanthobacter dioxanivorans]